jgi:uncharacterized protein (DUF2132 family)
VRCFNENPSIKSSLTFLRKTPWAREKIEAWYVRELKRYGKAGGSPPPPAAPES